MSGYDSGDSEPALSHPTQTDGNFSTNPVVADQITAQPDPTLFDDITPLPDPNNTTSETKKKKRNRPKKTGKKFKQPVPSSGKLKTYIDHGTTCDTQGYPIYPNGDTVFVREAKDQITNFVIPLSNLTTSRFPVCPAVKCSGRHVWTQCPGTSCRIDIEKESGWGVLCHSGTHMHVWPSSKKADPLAMLALKAQLVKNPKAGPLVLKLRRKVLVAKGLMPEKESKGGGDRLILDLMHWGRNGLRLISTSLLGADVHITFQTEWIAEQLVRRDQNRKVYSGGLLLDVTYRFFHNGYLLTTSMYNEIMHCWIPIQLTWIWGQEVNHYRAHFSTLLKQIKEADLTHHKRELLVQQVVDFSVAQKKGFVTAYMEVFNKNDPAKALDKLKGCHEHYCQSITRITKNRNVVDASQVKNFKFLALDLLEPDQPNGMCLGDKFDQLARLFPKSNPWLDWWNTADIHAMLFCARPRLPLDDPPLPGHEFEGNLPDTTNGQESMHRQYYILT
ncbi:uncharacterized protein MELLADRAFT_90953 [Melampsora larici-populina 98AG31]|uniref:GCM domain-containing protein n=1 Tax=Melampsora larici-populina (strain 98AG31 / pathotype 3-4-7) TaxID=747676 RepID=F4R857_MELLP|nr:uncharacterized protein MELLADRAFT_90953 [Melampsora larici-populina 98AG31]EGG11434.1 hypothetical protein MELLADRAFT_90953 [Melampsora larici-populina 98AG31]